MTYHRFIFSSFVAIGLFLYSLNDFLVCGFCFVFSDVSFYFHVMQYVFHILHSLIYVYKLMFVIYYFSELKIGDPIFYGVVRLHLGKVVLSPLRIF